MCLPTLHLPQYFCESSKPYSEASLACPGASLSSQSMRIEERVWFFFFISFLSALRNFKKAVAVPNSLQPLEHGHF